MPLNKAANTIKTYRLIRKKDKILIGVSGGPDSLALLYLLKGLKKEYKLDLAVAHLDHLLRRDSGRDAEFVKKLAGKMKIPFYQAKINIRKLAKKGSLEEAARNARLGFLFRVAKKIRADKIALGHNLDDQAETVLMRVLRGTGLYGLAAISPKRDIGGFEIIRPLIEVRRREIEAFLRKKKILPRRDISNLQDLYFRNKLRNRLLPLLEKSYNRNIKEALSNLAQSSAYDYDYLAARAQRAMGGMQGKINLARFSRLHPAMQRLVLRLNISRLKGGLRRITFRHIREIEDLISYRPLNSVVDLPGGVSARKKKQSLVFFLR